MKSKKIHNEIRIEVKNSDIFEGKFGIVNIDASKGIRAIIGKLKSNGSKEVKCYNFNKEKWTTEEATDWIKEHSQMTELLLGKNFEVDFNSEEIIPMKSISKKLKVELKNFDEEERSFDAIASTEAVDRDGDILRVNGWKLKNFKKNPVVLWGHNATLLPIAKATNIKVENNQLVFTPKFVSAELNPFAEQVYQMFKAGFLNTFSVRFDPIEYDNIEDDGKRSGDPFEMMMRGGGKDYKKQELLEISAVGIPSNPEALISRDFQDMYVKGMQLDNLDMLKDEVERNNILKGISKAEEYNCECIKCGHKLKSEKHCKDIECPECGGEMRRAERPGVGRDYENEEVVAKAGAVLSKKNKTLIKDAVEALNKLLESVEVPEEEKTFETEEELKRLQEELENLKDEEAVAVLSGQIKDLKRKLSV